MPIRNPFARKADLTLQTGLNTEDAVRSGSENGSHPTFEKVDTWGSKSSALSIKTASSLEPAEYKMSVVNDSGVYLPPSPIEKKSIWPRRSTSSRNSEDAGIEPFSISRESFDSYRRSFDISARSPVIPQEVGRQSLDSNGRFTRLPRSAIGERRFERQPPTAEEGFEDVGLNDEQTKQAKKKGFFSKLTESSDSTLASTSSRFHIPGRKRGQSGAGEELGPIQRPETATSREVAEVR